MVSLERVRRDEGVVAEVLDLDEVAAGREVARAGIDGGVDARAGADAAVVLRDERRGAVGSVERHQRVEAQAGSWAAAVEGLDDQIGRRGRVILK